MTSAHELREMYLNYFEKECGHTRVASAPIVPPDDPTMLFTSAGMVQFKPLYAGQVDPLPYRRAVTCQKCLRAGGKGSDLENVGRTSRHHTFFEMLGNFSFGDYFKREALEWGWDFILNRMKLPPERLWGTTFHEDPEAAEILAEILRARGYDNPEARIIPLDEKENFWGPAGETGACGPCSEIVFFMGTDKELQALANLDKDELARRIVEEGDLFLEIWNMVFPQYDQQPDGSRPPLKNRGIDTGAGLERMTTAMQFIETGGQVLSPYETDLLQPIVREAAELVGADYRPIAETETEVEATERFQINAIVDHARALVFTLSEGLIPSNEGRGYVLRRILRRALRYGYLLGMEEPFLHKLVPAVVAQMGDIYPEIARKPEHVAHVIRLEEERFLRTVAQGVGILDEKIAEARAAGEKQLDGETCFDLYATYGFPVDLTAEIAEDAGLGIDRAGYTSAMQRHQDEARQSWKGQEGGGEAQLVEDIFANHGETDFAGYTDFEAEATVLALVEDGKRVESLGAGRQGLAVLDRTPFYAESGGQVGDQGRLDGESGAARVTDCQKTPSSVFLHRIETEEGSLSVGDTLRARIDGERRLATMRNHSVTHLVQAALRRVLGDHITQAGSYVGPEGMRFDFQHMQAMTPEEIREVERRVNAMILEDLPITTDVLPIEEARARGAIAPFGEKYGHMVRLVQMGEVSLEFCGGSHLQRTGHIGSLRITGESSVAAGVRRIEAVTGMGAYESWAATRDATAELCRRLAVKEAALPERVAALQDDVRALQKEVKKLKTSGGGGGGGASVDGMIDRAKTIGGLRIVVGSVPGADGEQLRALADQVRDKCPDSVCLLGSAGDKKAMLVCSVGKDHTKRIQAGAIIKKIAPLVGGGGGGRPDMAQAGGKQPEKLPDALAEAPGIIGEMLQDKPA